MKRRPAPLNGKTLTLLRDFGYFPEVVEKTIPKSFIKKDLYGCFDLVAVGRGDILFIQVTSKSNASSRRKKVFERAETKQILLGGGRVLLILWHKPKHRWTHDIEEYTMEGLESGKTTKVPRFSYP